MKPLDSKPEASLNEARTNALRAIDLLVDHQVAPLPIPFAVAYEYCAGSLSELHQAMDAHLTEGKGLDEYFLREQYDLYLAADRFSRAHNMRNDIQNLLRALLKTLDDANNGYGEFHETLEANIRQLGDAPTLATIQQITKELLSAAIKAETSTGDMRHKLDHARKEAEELRVELEQQRRESLIDPLTGLYNRRALDQYGGELMKSGDNQLSLLLLDIDFFKSINDDYGHAVGDVVLRQVADTLRKCIRGDDIAVRYGGEEFVIVLPKTSLDGAFIVAESIRQRIESLRLLRRSDNMKVKPFTLSIGVSGRRASDTWDTLFQRADKALYQAKHEGRNKVIKES